MKMRMNILYDSHMFDLPNTFCPMLLQLRFFFCFCFFGRGVEEGYACLHTSLLPRCYVNKGWDSGFKATSHKSQTDVIFPQFLYSFKLNLMKQHESVFLQAQRAQRLKDDPGLCDDHQGQKATGDGSLGCR